MVNLLSLLGALRTLSIIRTNSAAAAVRSAHTLARSGFPLVEVTLNTPDALCAITKIREENPLVGAGTVLTAADTRAAAEAGAAFVVTPTVVPEVFTEAEYLGLPVLCGAYTPTEALTAWQSGATAVKLFPITSPGYLRDVRAPLTDIPFVPVGGITIDDVPSYLEAGAIAVGLGSALVGDGTEIEERAAALRKALDEQQVWSTARDGHTR